MASTPQTLQRPRGQEEGESPAARPWERLPIPPGRGLAGKTLQQKTAQHCPFSQGPSLIPPQSEVLHRGSRIRSPNVPSRPSRSSGGGDGVCDTELEHVQRCTSRSLSPALKFGRSSLPPSLCQSRCGFSGRMMSSQAAVLLFILYVIKCTSISHFTILLNFKFSQIA